MYKGENGFVAKLDSSKIPVVFQLHRRKPQAAECPSKNSCQQCDRRHHTSICDRAVKEEKNSGGGAAKVKNFILQMNPVKVFFQL